MKVVFPDQLGKALNKRKLIMTKTLSGKNEKIVKCYSALTSKRLRETLRRRDETIQKLKKTCENKHGVYSEACDPQVHITVLQKLNRKQQEKIDSLTADILDLRTKVCKRSQRS